MADETLRLLHFADLHLGVQSGGRIDPATGLNQRIVDICDRFDELCAVAEAESVDAVLFAGDAFNNQHPNPTLQSLFAARIRRLARGGTAVFLLIGNHDLPKMASLAHPFSIYEALEVEGVVVGDRAHVYRLPLRTGRVLQVAALPHFSRQQVLARHGDDVDVADQVARTVQNLGSEIDPALPSVFVGHCHVNQADVGDAQSLFGVSDVELPLSSLTSAQPFPYFALGHVHKRQVLADDPFVAYPGSLERIDHGEGERIDVSTDGIVAVREADPKGFYRFDLIRRDRWELGAPPEFRTVRARRFITIRVGTLEQNDPAADVARRVEALRDQHIDFDGAFVRIAGSIPAADRARVVNASAQALIPEAYDVRVALETVDGGLVRDPRFADPMSEIEALDRYLETRDDWADERDELRRLGRELMTEALDR